MDAKELRVLKRRLERIKKEIDDDVPNHTYDSALYLAAKADGVETAIKEVDKELAVEVGS
jgi:hypothetical protein